MPVINVQDSSSAQEFNNQTKNGSWLVWFYADWCGHCVNMKDEWEKLEKQCESNKNLNIAKVNSNNLGDIDNNMSANVMGYPTIRFINNNSNLKEEYNGQRTADAFMAFLKSKVGNMPTQQTQPSVRRSRKSKRRRSRQPKRGSRQPKRRASRQPRRGSRSRQSRRNANRKSLKELLSM